jgi:succinyl-diaminopimelate desuccinylase
MDAVKITQDLIALKSYDGEDKPFDYIKDLLESSGIKTRTVSSNGVRNLYCEIGKGEKELGFNGHYDTVPPGEGWTTDPLKPTIKKGRLYGLGATDMKGGLAAMIAAFIELSKEKLPIKVILQVAGDEEQGGENGSTALVKKGLVAKRMVVGEPSGPMIEHAHKGVLRVEIECRGKSAHGARIYAGDNAVLRAVRIVNRIATDSVLHVKATKKQSEKVTTCNVGYLYGGHTSNVVPSKCVFSLDIRIPEDESMDDVIHYLKGILDEKSQMRVTLRCTPMYTPPDNELVLNSKRIVEEALNTSIGLRTKLGACDGHLFTDMGIPTVAIGPAAFDRKGNKVLHTTDEYVEVSKIKIWKEIYKRLAHYYANRERG